MKALSVAAIFIFAGISSFGATPTIDIQNFHVVDAGKVYRGARPDASGIQELAQLGVRTVIDLQGGDEILGIPLEAGESSDDIAQESTEVTQAGMKFMSIPLSAINPDTDDQTAKIDQIMNLVSDPSNQPVYFHCRHGSDRTGLIGALYRVLYQSCTPDQAHLEMMEDGHSPLFPWIDDYFRDRVKNDPRTHLDVPGPSCPLSSSVSDE